MPDDLDPSPGRLPSGDGQPGTDDSLAAAASPARGELGVASDDHSADAHPFSAGDVELPALAPEMTAPAALVAATQAFREQPAKPRCRRRDKTFAIGLVLAVAFHVLLLMLWRPAWLEPFLGLRGDGAARATRHGEVAFSLSGMGDVLDMNYLPPLPPVEQRAEPPAAFDVAPPADVDPAPAQPVIMMDDLMDPSDNADPQIGPAHRNGDEEPTPVLQPALHHANLGSAGSSRAPVSGEAEGDERVALADARSGRHASDDGDSLDGTGHCALAAGSLRPSSDNRLPDYPDEARRRRIEGVALLHLRLLPTGAVTDASLLQSSGSTLLDAAALGAVRDWHYSPAVIDGKPAEFELNQPVRFSLPH